MRLALHLAVSAALLSACAPMPSARPVMADGSAGPLRQCFNVEQVRNFRQGDTGQVFVRANRDVYELNSSGGCTDLDFAYRLAIVPDVGGLGGGRVCTGDWARIVVPGSTSAASVYRARVSRVLTAEQVAALPSRFRP